VVVAQHPSVAFVADASTIDALLSSAVAAPTSNIVANGTAVSTITVIVRDAHGNVVPGQTVQLAATGSGNTLTQPPAPTNSSGVATGPLATTVAEAKTITATITPGAGQVVVAQQPSVTFDANPTAIDALLSSAAASPTSGVVANGVAFSTITVVVRDVN